MAVKKPKKTTKKPAAKKRPAAKKPAPARKAKPAPKKAAPRTSVGLAEIAPLAERIAAIEAALESLSRRSEKPVARNEGRVVDAPKVNTEVLALRADLYEIAETVARGPEGGLIVPVFVCCSDRAQLDRATSDLEELLEGSDVELLSIYRDQREPWVRSAFAKFSLPVSAELARQVYAQIARKAETHGSEESGVHLMIPNKGVDAMLVGDLLIVSWGTGSSRMRAANVLSHKDAAALSAEPSRLADAKSLLKQPAGAR